MAPVILKKQLWTPSQGRHNYADEQRRALRNMDAVLADTFQPSFREQPARSIAAGAPAKPLKIDLFEISAVAYNLIGKRKGYAAFATSLDEINSLLASRAAPEPLMPSDTAIQVLDYDADEQQLDQWQARFPQYTSFWDVHSKRASDQLPPHRLAVDHKIELTQDNNLGHSPLYRMTTEELAAVKEYLLENLHKGFIVPSSAPFASPVLFVSKPNGGLRFCVDYRKLNSITKKDQHPLPLIDETLACICNAKIFAKLNIRQAFHRIRVDSSAEELITFRTRYGTYKYQVLSFSLTNGPATYQRYMNKVLFDYLDDFCTAYLDDILIYSDNVLEHENHVKLVL